MDQIKQTVLSSPVEGLNLQPGTLRNQLSIEPTLFVFLRHFGCVFCRETVKELRRVALENPNYPPIMFFYQGTVEDGEVFFEKFWPEARAVADKHQYFYQAFGLTQGNVTEVLGLEVWVCSIRAAMKGNFMGMPVGDTWMMPGLFLVQDQEIVWQHKYRHVGDHPNFSKITEYSKQLTPVINVR